MSKPTLNVSFSTSTRRQPVHAYGLQVTVTSSTLQPEVFIFRRGATPAPVTGYAPDEEPTDTFICIADPVDIEDVPVNEPDLANEMPYYRVAEVLLYFRSPEDLEETKQHIEDDLNVLVRTLQALENVNAYNDAGTTVIG